MRLQKILSYLAPVDIISITFLLFLISLNLIFFSRVTHWLALVLINFFVIIIIITLAFFADTKKTKFFVLIHRFYSYLIVIFVFKEIYLMVYPIHPVDYDELLIIIDKWIFGVHPTQWLYQFAHPLLTEILQIAYFSYYMLFIIFGIEIYLRFPIREFDKCAFFIVYGFYLSYLGYFLLPAVGPRFTLHDFYSINNELPGLLFTPWIRDFINLGESTSFYIPNALATVQRDVFPSGHTQLTLVVLFLSHRYVLKTRWLLTILGILLIIGSVYLRYHYVVDILGGIVFFVLTIWSGNKIKNWWDKKKLTIVPKSI